MPDFKIYSPSQTKKFLQCPMAWKLYKDGWVSKKYNKGNLYALRGLAVSAGLDFYNRHGNSDAVDGVVVATLRREYDEARIGEREWNVFKSLPYTCVELTQQALLLVRTYIENPPLAFTVVHSEYIFAKHGNARADVIGKLANGKILPVDYKCKDVPTNSFFQFSIKQDYRYDWQLMHYCWAVSEEFHVDCLDFGIVVLWYDKKPRIEYVPFIVNTERLANWYLSAREVWSHMEACEKGEAAVTEVAEHKTVYGPCEFKTACLEYNRHEDLMHNEYFYMPRRK